MSKLCDRAARCAVIGLGAMLLLLPPALAGNAATSGEVQLAQAAQPGAPPEQDQTAELQRTLQITPAQQPQFQAFARTLQQNAAAMDAILRRYPPDQHRSALEELRGQSEAADAEAAGLKRLVPAFEALYTTLSPSQKQTADQMLAEPPAGNQAPPR